MNPLVSILIPCYNSQKWLEECIDSALGQEHSPIEVIVVDDGSTDGSAEILRKYGSRIQFEVAPHLGANAARQRLLELAKGEWVQYLDADDYLLPDKISGQLAFLDTCGEKPDIIYSPPIRRDEYRGGHEYCIPFETIDDAPLQYIRWGPFCVHGIIVRRSALVEVGGWKVDQPVCQEHEMLLRLLKAQKRFAPFDKAACVYRLHGNPSVSSRDPLLTLRTQMGLIDSLEAFLDGEGRKTARHSEALFVVRAGTARGLYNKNAEYARQLMNRAVANGRFWVRSAPALPMHYQMALRLLGFDRAERLAAWWRTALSRS